MYIKPCINPGNPSTHNFPISLMSSVVLTSQWQYQTSSVHHSTWSAVTPSPPTRQLPTRYLRTSENTFVNTIALFQWSNGRLSPLLAISTASKPPSPPCTSQTLWAFFGYLSFVSRKGMAWPNNISSTWTPHLNTHTYSETQLSSFTPPPSRAARCLRNPRRQHVSARRRFFISRDTANLTYKQITQTLLKATLNKHKGLLSSGLLCTFTITYENMHGLKKSDSTLFIF